MHFKKKIFGKYIVIFVYHRVSPEKDTYFLPGIEPEEFEKQISYLKENFKIYSLKKLINGLKRGKINKKEHENIAVITFDDGYRDNYIYAYPILKKYHIPATFFLTTDYIGQGKLFWWDKLGYIIGNAKNGMINLPDLGKCLLDDKKK